MTGQNFASLPPTQRRNQAYTGQPLDDFSKLMYQFRSEANEGFTALDFDFVLRNYKKKSFAILEVKTGTGILSHAQQFAFREIGFFLKEGTKGTEWTCYGVNILSFENTSFDNGRAYFNNNLITKDQFFTLLKNYF